MRIYLDNIDPNSSSGPNSFGKKLANEFKKNGHTLTGKDEIDSDVQLSFIHMTRRNASKVALRLDGIYFNSKQDWQRLNAPIKSSFEASNCVIYQTEFNMKLTEKFFGKPKKSFVINNGTDTSSIDKIQAASHPLLDRFDELWCCSSSWRPHKRLKDNIDYFHQMKRENSALIVLGENPDHLSNYSDVFYAGKLSWEECISVYKKCKKFIHLAFLDHCPNVVVDARAAGCELVISSSGGTREIAGIDATVIRDLEWDMSPLDLYSPPPLDFSNSFKNNLDSNIEIQDVASKYIRCLSML